MNNNYVDSRTPEERANEPESVLTTSSSDDIVNFEDDADELCIECGTYLFSNEVEILNTFYEIGGYCPNKECKRFKILVV